MKNFILIISYLFTTTLLHAQATKTIYSLKDTAQLQALNVTVSTDVFKNKESLKVVDINPNNNTELRFVKLADTSFHNGIIEVELAGEPMKAAFESARGFVGIAFRLNSSNEKFECIYLRPTNGRALDQVRRNHSVQYISYPNFPWQKLRKEFPEKYETYVDLEAGTWTKLKIEVKDSTAKLFVHGSNQPTLIVSDLKHGEQLKGAVGLWIGPGTEAHFRKLVITKFD